MSHAYEPLYACDLRRRYKLTAWEIRQGQSTGFIRAVAAPYFARDGRRLVTDEHQMDVYIARQREWERRFLDGARMTAYIKAPRGGVPARINSPYRLIVRQAPYRSVIPPPYYLFHGTNRRKYWHVEDLDLFIRFINAVQNRTIQSIGHPNYDPDEHVWRPKYPSPPDFPERYTDETRDRVLNQ